MRRAVTAAKAAAGRVVAVGALAAAALAAAALAAAALTSCGTSGADAGAGAANAHGAGRTSGPDTGTSYYLALGDSLSQGIQPGPAGADEKTRRGYPDQLLAVLRQKTPGLRLVKLGCSGETTTTMMHGGICSYPQGSQLAAAVSFLRAHPGQVSLITIDIGANDPNSCLLGGQLTSIGSCLNAHVSATVANLAKILARLRAAGGSKVTIIGMSYYVPELAGWLYGQQGKEVAVLSERLASGFNRMLANVYQRFSARVANVFSAFHSADFTDRVSLPRLGTVPRNVATVCEWTWACAREPDEHPNDIGYGIIALAFLLADQR
jgi:lysophospholipase L1-like esterase